MRTGKHGPDETRTVGFSELGFDSLFNNEDSRCKVPAHHYQLLRLRQALTEKELQLGELRSEYCSLLSKSSEACKSLEKSIKSKELAIHELHTALENREKALKRHEKLIDEAKRRLAFQEKSEKFKIERKDLEISLLKAENIHQAGKLADQEKIIAFLSSQDEKREQQFISYSKHVKQKVENLQEQLKELGLSLQQKEEELMIQEKSCNDLKVLVWKRESMLEQLWHTQKQLKSSLERQNLAFETIELAKQKLEEEKSYVTKSLIETKRKLQACEAALVHESQMQDEIAFQQSTLDSQNAKIHKLKQALNKAESILNTKCMELQTVCEEKKMLTEEYDLIKTNYESLVNDHTELQIKLVGLEEKAKQNKYFKNDIYFQDCNYLSEENHGQQFLNQGFKICGKEHRRWSINIEDQVPYKDCGTSSGPLRSEREWHTGVRMSSHYASQFHHDKGVTFQGDGARNAQHGTSILLGSIQGLDVKNVEHTLMTDTDQVLRSSNIYSQVCDMDELQNGWVFQSDARTLTHQGCIKEKVDERDRGDDKKSSASLELQRIQEEIEKRERSWKCTEANMRAELSRRMAQLREAQENYGHLFVEDLQGKASIHSNF